MSKFQSSYLLPVCGSEASRFRGNPVASFPAVCGKAVCFVHAPATGLILSGQAAGCGIDQKRNSADLAASGESVVRAFLKDLKLLFPPNYLISSSYDRAVHPAGDGLEVSFFPLGSLAV